MLSIRQQLILTSISYLAFASPVSAQGGWANGDQPGTGNNNNNGDGFGYTGSGNNNGNGNTNGPNSDFVGGQPGGSTTRLITIHAVLACLVWVFLIPLGGILIRSGIKSPHLVRIHAFLQSFSYLIYIVAAGMGIYLVHELSVAQYSLWSDPHTRIGAIILILALLMPFLGLIHHRMYKRRAASYKLGGPRPGRTVPGYIHLWLGRLLIPLGMVNGGLGLRLASHNPFGGNSRTQIIAYSVGAGIMFLLYVIFVVTGEIRRSRERKGQSSNSRSIPMRPQAYEPVRTIDQEVGNVPPTYEQSQTFLPANGAKHTNGTARYQ